MRESVKNLLKHQGLGGITGLVYGNPTKPRALGRITKKTD